MRAGGIRLFVAIIAAALSTPALAAFLGEDVVIIVDTASHNSSAEMSGIKSFLTRFDDNLAGRNNTRIGIIQYAVSTSTVYNLTGSQSTSSVDAAIATLPGSGSGAGSHALDAFNAAIAMFDAQSTPEDPKRIVVVCGTNPNPSSTQTPSAAEAGCESRGIQNVLAFWGANVNSNTYSAMDDGGGHIYTYGADDPLTTSTADQFLTDSATYFNVSPEPGSIAMMSVCGVLFAARRRR